MSIINTINISSDGRWIVYNGNGRGSSDLFLMDVSTLKVRQLTDTAQEETHPCFSPDGKLIAYTASLPGVDKNGNLFPHHIFICDLTSGSIAQITSDKDRWDYSPSFSSDGKYIVFDGAQKKSLNSYPGDIYVVDIATRQCRRITHEGYSSMLRPKFWRGDLEVLFTAYKSMEQERGTYLCSVSTTQQAKRPIPITPFGLTTSQGQPISEGKILLISDLNGELDYKVCLFDVRTRKFAALPSVGSVPFSPVCSGTIIYWIAGLGNLYRMDIAHALNAKPKLLADPSLFDAPSQWFNGRQK